MLKYKIFILTFYLKGLFCPCAKDNFLSQSSSMRSKVSIERVGRLSESVKECSGIAMAIDTATKDTVLCALGDSGNPPRLYLSDLTSFNLADSLDLPGVRNHDWEELQYDSGIFYIGDFGNNRNSRRDLCILTFRPETGQIGTINFRYEDQTTFPPAKDSLWFDAEAFLKEGDSLWVFTKCRGERKSAWYTLPATPGDFEAKLRRTVPLRSLITGAAWSPDHQMFALLSYGKIYLFKVGVTGIHDASALGCIRFSRSGQSEAIAWSRPGEILVLNEAGKAYRIKLKKRQ